eukprot:gene23068-43563_t
MTGGMTGGKTALCRWALAVVGVDVSREPEVGQHSVPATGAVAGHHGWGEQDSGRGRAMFGRPGGELADGSLDLSLPGNARRFDMGERASFANRGFSVPSRHAAHIVGVRRGEGAAWPDGTTHLH